MFGFLGSPCARCASGNSHPIYRNFFCGLSSSLRDDYSPAARFLVNRDSTFLSLLTASIGTSPPVATTRTCCQPVAVGRCYEFAFGGKAVNNGNWGYPWGGCSRFSLIAGEMVPHETERKVAIIGIPDEKRRGEMLTIDSGGCPEEIYYRRPSEPMSTTCASSRPKPTKTRANKA